MNSIIPSLRREPVVIAPEAREIIKRDGSLVSFDQLRILKAVAHAMFDFDSNGASNPGRGKLEARFGLPTGRFAKAELIAFRAERMLDVFYNKGRTPTIEDIQDTVERAIACEDEWGVARKFIHWRQQRSEMRLARHPENGLSDYIAISRYCRYDPSLGRRELWDEAVSRVEGMHRTLFSERGQMNRRLPLDLPGELGDLVADPAQSAAVANVALGKSVEELISGAFAEVRAKRVLPSMRSLQFGGQAVLRNHMRLYNCSYSPVDRPEFFREYLFLLLSGTGCGFSVQKEHVDRLPPLPPRGKVHDLPVVHHHVGDTIEGWADALDALIRSYYDGHYVEFDFSQIRPKGALLKTSGGRAPGHLPLRKALVEADRILSQASGRNLRPIEVYDLNMHVAQAVLSGGSRRSATIALFSPDDEEMMNAKTGDWFSTHPQRSASNNSAVLVRKTTDEATFRKLFKAVQQFGEPGFYFVEDSEYGCNPCAEIGLFPVVRGVLPDKEVAKLAELGVDYPNEAGSRLSGWSMCNLSTINAGALSNPQEFYEACAHAATIGTLQAAYTDCAYLGGTSRYILERDSLLGVSICGFMDNPQLLFDPSILERGAGICQAVNRMLSEQLGIRPAARITTTKPEGTSSLVLGSASGIHPRHAKRYFRRVTCTRGDPIAEFFRSVNPHMVEPSVYHPDTDDIITFPVEVPDGAFLKKDLAAIEFLDLVRLVQNHWVKPGTADSSIAPGLLHNVSNTCPVKASEWDAVADYIWQHRDSFTGIALLPNDGDKRYAQAPEEEVISDTDIAKWNALRYSPVPWADLQESQDLTKLADVVACAGGACQLPG